MRKRAVFVALVVAAVAATGCVPHPRHAGTHRVDWDGSAGAETIAPCEEGQEGFLTWELRTGRHAYLKPGSARLTLDGEEYAPSSTASKRVLFDTSYVDPAAIDEAYVTFRAKRSHRAVLAIVGGCAPEVGPPPEPCDQTTTSGGAGVTSTVHELAATSGTFSFAYEAYSVPDQFDVYYEGALVFSTDAPVSGSATVPITYGPGTSTEITVVVTGPGGTAWQYLVGCPDLTPV